MGRSWPVLTVLTLFNCAFCTYNVNTMMKLSEQQPGAQRTNTIEMSRSRQQQQPRKQQEEQRKAAATTKAASDSPYLVHPFAQLFDIHEPEIMLKGREPGLVVDVGGHVGWTVRDAVKYGHRAVAFEPFPGNCNQFRLNMKNWSMAESVTLHCAGAAQKTGWGKAVTTKLVGSGTDATTVFSMTSCKEGETGCIKSYALDDVIKEHVMYLKIDVQGGEMNVLEGATTLFDKYGVDAVFVETTQGDPHVKWLYDRGYTCMDFPYLAIQSTEKPTKRGRSIREKIMLTNGLPAYYYLEKERPSELSQTMRLLNEYTQNDYLCLKTPWP